MDSPEPQEALKPRRVPTKLLLMGASAAQQLGLALWLGGLVTIGAVVAPAAFRDPETRAVAGVLVGNSLRVFNWLTLVAAALLILGLAAEAFHRPRKGWHRLWELGRLAAAALALGITLYFIFSAMPQLESLRSRQQWVEFNALHRTYTRLGNLQMVLLLGILLANAVLHVGMGDVPWRTKEPASQ